MLSVLSPYTKIIEAVVLAVALYFGYLYVGDKAVDRYKTDQAVLQAKADKLQQEKFDKLSADYVTLQSQRTEATNTITRSVQTIVKQPIYQTSCVTPEGVELANKALEGKL